jgi:antitoxin ChpS
MEVTMLQTLRRAGGSLVMTVPKAFIEQNGLGEGSQVELHLLGKTMTVEAPTRPRYKLADLMAEMPEGLPLAEGWDEMPSIGLENG